MNILDTFYTLFKSDTSDLDKGLDESGKKAEQLAEKLKGVDLSALQLGGTLKDLAMKGAALLGVSLSVHAIAGAIEDTAKENMQLKLLADRFGTTADKVDEFVDAGQLLGLSNEQTIGGLTSLDRAIQDTALGMGRAKKVFEELGIEVTDANGKIKPVTETMEALQEKFKGMDKGTQIRIMERLGLDPALLKLFNADMGALQGRMNAIDTATGFNLDRAVRRAQEFTKAQKAMKLEVASLQMYMSKLKESFAVSAMPVFTKALQTAAEWLNKLFKFVTNNSKLAEGVIIAIAGAISAYLLPAAIRGAIAVGAMVAPFLLVGLAVAAVIAVFALAYDDIMNFMEGNDSLIGQIFQKYPMVEEIVRGIGDVFKWLGQTIWDVLQIVAAIWIQTFQKMWDFGKQAVDGVSGALSPIGEVFKALSQVITGIIQYWIDLVGKFIDKFGGIAGIAKTIGGGISGFLGAAKDKLGIGEGTAGVPGLLGGQQQLAIAGATPLAAQTSNSITGAKTSNKSTQVKIDKVEVSTQATDAAGISKSIGDSLGAQMRQAVSNYDDGVAY